jgi:hypothetical protein
VYRTAFQLPGSVAVNWNVPAADTLMVWPHATQLFGLVDGWTRRYVRLAIPGSHTPLIVTGIVAAGCTVTGVVTVTNAWLTSFTEFNVYAAVEVSVMVIAPAANGSSNGIE